MKRSLFLNILLLSLASLFMACGPSGEGQIPRDQGLSTQDLNKQQEIQFKKTAKPLNFSWPKLDSQIGALQLSLNEGPHSFGHLITKTVRIDQSSQKPKMFIKTGNCQGSLIAPNLFLTGRHCIPKDLQQKNASCQERIKVILPAISDEFPMEILECDKVLRLSQQTESLVVDDPQPDWAILKLMTKKSKRFIKPITSGIEDGEKLYSFIPLLDPETEQIKIHKVICEAKQNSLMLPEFEEANSVLAFLQCHQNITKGFSGSSLFKYSEKKGYQPVAVLSHLRDVQLNQETILVSKSIVASNFSCITEKKSKKTKNQSHCQFDPAQRQKKKEKILIRKLKKLKKAVDESIADWLEDNETPVVWEEIQDDNWQDLPEEYLNYFNDNNETQHPILQAKNRALFTQIIVPIYAKCIRKDVLPEEGMPTRIPMKLPMIKASLYRSPSQKVRKGFELIEVNVEIRLGQNNHYILKPLSPVTTFEVSKNLIIGGQFAHSSVYIPVCE